MTLEDMADAAYPPKQLDNTDIAFFQAMLGIINIANGRGEQ